MATDPFALFDEWFAEARASEPNDPEAMALATADADGQPSVRMVLLKGHGPDGFVFYTNEQSAKGERAGRQSRARRCSSTGSRCAARCASKARSSASPTPRPTPISPRRARDSQLGAWASDQSRPLDSRDDVRSALRGGEARFEGEDVPRPPHWGGYRVVPERIEFWSDRPHRLHERRLFTRDGDGWTEGLLYP